MSRDLTTAMASGLAARVVNMLLLAEFEFDSGTIRMWSGVGTLTWNGHDYLGGGNLVGVSQYTETEDMQANGMGFMLTGIDASLISAAYNEEYQRRPCTLYIALLGDTTGGAGEMLFESGATILLESGDVRLLESGSSSAAVLADPYPWFRGYMNVMKIDRSGETASITLSAENEFIVLKQNRLRRYTSEDQRAEYPGDAGMDFAATIPDANVIWGKK